jgi:hypothetical protein
LQDFTRFFQKREEKTACCISYRFKQRAKNLELDRESQINSLNNLLSNSRAEVERLKKEVDSLKFQFLDANQTVDNLFKEIKSIKSTPSPTVPIPEKTRMLQKITAEAVDFIEVVSLAYRQRFHQDLSIFRQRMDALALPPLSQDYNTPPPTPPLSPQSPLEPIPTSDSPEECRLPEEHSDDCQSQAQHDCTPQKNPPTTKSAKKKRKKKRKASPPFSQPSTPTPSQQVTPANKKKEIKHPLPTLHTQQDHTAPWEIKTMKKIDLSNITHYHQDPTLQHVLSQLGEVAHSVGQPEPESQDDDDPADWHTDPGYDPPPDSSWSAGWDSYHNQ